MWKPVAIMATCYSECLTKCAFQSHNEVTELIMVMKLSKLRPLHALHFECALQGL